MRTPVGAFASAAAAAGSPATTNLWTWIKADAGVFTDTARTTAATADGDVVNGITDQSGGGRHWAYVANGSSNGGPFLRLSVLNAKPVFRFEPTMARNICPPDMSSLTAGHIFAILKLATAESQSNVALWRFGTSGQGMFYPFDADHNIYDDWGSNTRRAAGDPTPTLAGFRLYEVISTSAEWTPLIDGTGLSGATGTNTVSFSSAPRVGQDSVPGAFEGDIAEILIYSAKITGADLTQTKNYLAGRYGLTFA